MRSLSVVFLVFFAFYTTLATASDQIGAGTSTDPAWYYGTPQYMGNGAFHTYVAIDHENEVPVAMGCEFSKSFLFDTPFDVMPGVNGEVMTHIELDLPDITTTYTPFQSYESNWMPLGHQGTPYNVAHIDFHFYLVNQEKRNLWGEGICNGGTSPQTFCKAIQPVPAPCCPPTYLNLGIAAPRMGNHLLSYLDPVLNGQPFEQTFIFGTSEGRIVFYEPMVTLDFFQKLTGRQCFPIMNPTNYTQAGMYPSQYCVYTTDNNFRIEMNEFTYITGGCGTVEEFGPASCAYDASSDTAVTENWVMNCNSCPYYQYTKAMVKNA